MKTQQGVKNFTRDEATKIAGEDPDYMIRDMYEAIERKEYPSWDVFVQVMDPSEAENYRWNIFDMTKVWPHSDFPLRKIGKMTLNRNVSLAVLLSALTVPNSINQPNNYFADIEQAAFSPSTMVPGFSASADPGKSIINPVIRSLDTDNAQSSSPSPSFRLPRRSPLPRRCQLPTTSNKQSQGPSILPFRARRQNEI